MKNLKDICNFVIESGRVSGEGDEWYESLAIEMEFEASEQGVDGDVRAWIKREVA